MIVFGAICIFLTVYQPSHGECCNRTAETSFVKLRLGRSLQQGPQPVDCELSSWTSWSSCDPCQKKRYRFAHLTRPAQFRGEPCETIDRQEESCKTNAPCRNTKRCEGFQCAESGKCIARRLLCNGDDDCSDQSDEKDCKTIRRPCTDDMEELWGIEKLASGYNLLTNEREGLVLDNRYYAGACSPHYILGTRFRKPYNVESYSPQTKGEYEFQLSEYESYSDFERKFFSSYQKQTSFNLAIKIPEVIEIGVSYSDMNFKKNVERVKKYSHTSSKFIHAQSTLEIARYKLKSQNLMLHTEFFQRIKHLPVEYVYGEYRDLFRDYGTHYITEATLGGTYEYTLILKSDTIKNEGYSLSDVKSCVSAGVTLGGNICGVWVGGSMSDSQCEALLKEIGDGHSTHQLLEDFIAVVRGGASEHITTLAYKNLPTPELMQEWGDAVQYNPDTIKVKVSPLYELVTTTDFSSGTVLRENMKRALEEYLAEASSCRCVPCKNNGVPFLKESRCECICPSGFKGSSCESTRRSVPPADGNWSCWSGWTPCSKREKTRQRQCNNPPPSGGGKQCEGAGTETSSC